jgi:hypothetical protein
MEWWWKLRRITWPESSILESIEAILAFPPQLLELLYLIELDGFSFNPLHGLHSATIKTGKNRRKTILN